MTINRLRHTINATCDNHLVLISRKELVMEGHRLHDILRQGGEVTRQGGYHFLNATDLITVNWNDYRTIMPIPQAEIDANTNMIQNPEYN